MKAAIKQALRNADMPSEEADVAAVVTWAFGGPIGRDNGNRMAIAWNELHPQTFILHATDNEDEAAARIVSAYAAK